MRKLILLPAIALAALLLAGCPSNYHTLVTIEHDFDSSVKALQSGSTAEFQAGNIDAPTNQTIEGVVLKLAQGGQQINTLLQQNASKQTIAQQTANISADLQSLLATGLVGVKNPTTKQELTVLIQATQAVVANFTTELGASK